MKLVEAKTFADAYESVLLSLVNDYEYLSGPRSLQTKEVLDIMVKIDDPFSNLFYNKIRSIPKKYLAGELVWYLTARNDLYFIEKYSKFWRKIANKDRTLNSAYGHLIFKPSLEDLNSQWSWAYESLLNDKESRQAIVRFNNDKHQVVGNKDFVCTLLQQYFIRDNKLICSSRMRSCDVFLGLSYDLPFFMLLHQQMWKHLKEEKYHDLEMGHHIYSAGSLHLYEKHFETAEEMLKHKFVPEQMPKIEKNLIYPGGVPTNSMKKLAECILDKKEKPEFDDKLYDWITIHSMKGK